MAAYAAARIAVDMIITLRLILTIKQVMLKTDKSLVKHKTRKML
jgi:hypothetical protein